MPCGRPIFYSYFYPCYRKWETIFLGWPDDSPHPLPVGVAPNPWIPFIMVMVTHILPLECVHFDEYNADNVTLKASVHTSEKASEKHHYFALVFTGMDSVPSRLRELWRQPVYTRASVLHALSCACTEKHPLTTVSITRTW